MSSVTIVDFEKQCSHDCKKCEQCYVIGHEGEKNYWNCNQECAACMQCNPTFQTPPLTYTIPIPRDTLTLTHQPEHHPYIPKSKKKTNYKNCKNCDNFYLNDHYKHLCFECNKKKHNYINTPMAYNPYLKHFYYKLINEY
jgi:hypothetical protein